MNIFDFRATSATTDRNMMDGWKEKRSEEVVGMPDYLVATKLGGRVRGGSHEARAHLRSGD